MSMSREDLRAYYCPHEPDPTLEDEEYYYLQSTQAGERVIRVFALDVLPHRDGTEYGIYQRRGTRLVRVDTGYGETDRGARKSDLYDNAQDCRDRTHMMYEDWQTLRREGKDNG